MLGVPLRYLAKHPIATLLKLAADPRQTGMLIHDEYVAARERSRPQCTYHADGDWEERLHRALGVAWPCEAAAEFWALWPTVIAELEAKGIRVGPESFQCWNDGDAALVRAIWCLVRHRKPETVVETGVGHGVTSRFILEAMALNGGGHLWSIDLPPVNPRWRAQVGMAVGEGHGERWTLIEGSTRRRLPELLAKLGAVDLFLHDSLHSERNVRFELDRAWAMMREEGVVVVDDVDANWGFQTFRQAFPGHQSLIGEAEPVRPDLRRFNQKGLFGVILKQAAPSL